MMVDEEKKSIHFFGLKGDTDSIYASRPVGVTLTIASQLYSAGFQVDTTSHTLIEMEQLH